MLPEGIEFRAMKPSDLDVVLQIIRDHDEAAEEAAEEAYDSEGLDGQYVLVVRSEVIGMTGFRPADGTDNSYWLSTYLGPGARGRGLAKPMLEELMDQLNQEGARKLFVNTSDYSNPASDPLYEESKGLYESLGFRLELSYKDYYTPGRSRLTYARRLGSLYGVRPEVDPDPTGIELADVFEIYETDRAFAIDWDYADDESMFSPKDLAVLVNAAREEGARCIFVGFPSDLAQVPEVMKQSPFVQCGRLMDFFVDGLDEVHYRLDL